MKVKNFSDVISNHNYSYILYKKTNSTMIKARNYLKKNNSNFIINADEQSKGKGRHGNSWHSNKGNIFLSIGVSNNLKLQDYFLYNLITLISVKKVLNIFGSKKIKFKWPNDLYFNNQKFGGIIIESCQSLNKINFAIIGIGLNFSSSPNLLKYKTTHIKDFCDINSKDIFLSYFFKYFFLNIQKYKKINQNLILEYKKSLMFLNKEIKVKVGQNKLLKGIFIDISNDGSLILKTKNKLFSLYSGSIQ